MTPKGGSRKASDEMPIGKGMGLIQHFETLKALDEMQNSDGYTITEVAEEMNRRFAWWDDPKAGGPVETCRSYLKEMWRLGMIDRIKKDGYVMERSPKNWKLYTNTKFLINERGHAIIEHSPKCFPYITAWCILETVDMGMHPQCYKLFKLAKIVGTIPINNPSTTKLTAMHGIRVEEHANKAIKFGWLEPTGLIYKINHVQYRVNEKFCKWLRQINTITDIFSNVNADVVTSDLTVTITPPYMGYISFERGRIYDFQVRLQNKTNRNLNVNLTCIPSAMLEHISKFSMETNYDLLPHQTKDVTLKVSSESYGVGNSFGKMHTGLLRVLTNQGTDLAYLPTVVFAKRDRVWEIRVLEMLRNLQLYTLHLGQSDRPDGVVSLSRSTAQPANALDYLRDKTAEKLLVETTLGTYSWDKRIKDTQTTDGESKFLRHTSKVLKIEASGQLIVADAFSSNFDIIEEKREHTVTFITMDVLKYMVDKRKEVGDGHNAIRELLLSNKKVEITDVNAAFEKL